MLTGPLRFWLTALAAGAVACGGAGGLASPADGPAKLVSGRPDLTPLTPVLVVTLPAACGPAADYQILLDRIDEGDGSVPLIRGISENGQSWEYPEVPEGEWNVTVQPVDGSAAVATSAIQIRNSGTATVLVPAESCNTTS